MKKLTARAKLANKFNTRAKLAEKIIRGGHFDKRYSSGTIKLIRKLKAASYSS